MFLTEQTSILTTASLIGILFFSPAMIALKSLSQHDKKPLV